MIKLMIFDHDMTIVDSSYAIMAGFNFVAEKEGLPKVSHEQVMQYIATPIPAFCEGLLGEYRPEWVKMYRENNSEFEKKLIRPFEDTVPTMRKLRDMDITLAVASNREDPRRAMERTGLAQYFDEIVGAAEPWGRLPYKPNPAMLLELMKRLNVPAENTIYVGDADIDVMTAMAAGVRGIGITLGNFNSEDFKKLGAWRSIGSLSELVEIVNENNKNAGC